MAVQWLSDNTQGLGKAILQCQADLGLSMINYLLVMESGRHSVFKVTLEGFQSHLFHMSVASWYVLELCSLGPLFSSFTKAPMVIQMRTVSGLLWHLPHLFSLLLQQLGPRTTRDQVGKPSPWLLSDGFIIESVPWVLVFTLLVLDIHHSLLKSIPSRKFGDLKGLGGRGCKSEQWTLLLTDHFLWARNYAGCWVCSVENDIMETALLKCIF